MEVFLVVLGQYAKLDVHQSVFTTIAQCPPNVAPL